MGACSWIFFLEVVQKFQKIFKSTNEKMLLVYIVSSMTIEGFGTFFLFLRAKKHLKNTHKKTFKAKTKASKAKAKVSTQEQSKGF